MINNDFQLFYDETEVYFSRDSSLISNNKIISLNSTDKVIKSPKLTLLQNVIGLTRLEEEMILEVISNKFGLFINVAEDSKLPKKYSKKISNNNFYPGSFNPWHEGHSHCVERFLDKTNEGLIIVLDKSPWKESDLLSPLKSYLDLIEAYENEDRVSVYPGFILSKDRNPTYSWISKITGESKSLLMGDDCFLSIERWFASEKLLNEILCIYVLARNTDENIRDSHTKNLQKLYPKLKIIFLGNHKYEEISSSEIRKR